MNSANSVSSSRASSGARIGLQVESAPGEGTSVRIIDPIHPAPVFAVAPPRTRAHTSSQSSGPGCGPREGPRRRRQAPGRSTTSPVCARARGRRDGRAPQTAGTTAETVLGTLLTQPAVASVPIAFATMVGVSLLQRGRAPEAGALMAALHVPEGVT